MTKVLIHIRSIAGLSKFEDLSKALSKKGNHSMVINSFDLNDEFVFSKIEEFNPDLIISSNNSLGNLENFSCPILIYDADSPDLFFNKDSLKSCYKNENIFFLFYQSNSRFLYKNQLGIDIDPSKSLFFPPSTGFSNKVGSNIDKNISFVGSSFFNSNAIINTALNNCDVASDFDQLEKDYLTESKFLSSQFSKDLFVYRDRVKYLDVISDLGLNIFSNTDWRKEFSFIYPEVTGCYKDIKVFSSTENQEIYNSSKISINLSHPQAINSYSWRVPDIMASNSCLLMEEKSDWLALYSDHLSREVIDSIVYKDRFDMREKCIKLLNDDKLRSKCVAESNNAVKKRGSWDVRIEELSSFLDLNLIGNKRSEGSIVIIQNEVDADCDKKSKKSQYSEGLNGKIAQKDRLLVLFYHLPFFKNLISYKKYVKSRNKIIICCQIKQGAKSKKRAGKLFLSFATIPFLGNLFFSNKRLSKMIMKNKL